MATGQNICRALFLTCLPLFFITSSFADTSLLNPQPNFAGVAGGGVTANASNCFLGDASAAQGSIGGASALDLSALGFGGKKGSVGMGDCKATAIPGAGSLDCNSSLIQDPSTGNFSPALLQQQIDSLSALDGKNSSQASDSTDSTSSGSVGGSLGCELNQFDKIKKEMACVQNQGQLLTQQIGSLSQVYQQNIMRFQQDDQAFQMREADRQTQLTAIQQLLGGNKNSGTKGLLGEQADLQKLVNNTMPQDIAGALAQSQTVANQRGVILENIQKHTMSLTGDCFKSNPKAGYKCDPGGPDLSPENYIVCMYGKYAHVNPNNGQYILGALADSNASAAQNTLQGIMDQMTSLTSLSWSTPTDPASAAATAQKPSFGNTIQDLNNNFVSKTDGMTVNGLSVATVITNELQSCYLSAQAEVASERTDPSSAISQAQFQQTQSETALKAGFDQKLEQYSQKWTEAMGVLSNQNLPLNLSNCKSQDVTYEGSCLTDVQNQLTGLLKGNASQAPFTMVVPAQFPDTQIPIQALQCQGINGCVTQLQAVNDQVTQAKTQLTTQRQAYEQQARQSTDQFTQQVAAMLSNQSAALRQQLTSINSRLQGLGVSGNIGFPNVQGKGMQYETNSDGSQGIPKMPTDVMALIGSQMSPPMMDLTDNSNNDGSAMARAQTKVEDQLQKVQLVRDKWQSLASECSKGQISTDFDAAVLNLSQCSNFCNAYNTHATQLLQAAEANSAAAGGKVMPVTSTVDAPSIDMSKLSQLFQAVQTADNKVITSDSSSSDGGGFGAGKVSTDPKAQAAAIAKDMSVIAGLANECDGTTIDNVGTVTEINAGGQMVPCPNGAISGQNPNSRGKGNNLGGSTDSGKTAADNPNGP